MSIVHSVLDIPFYVHAIKHVHGTLLYIDVTDSI